MRDWLAAVRTPKGTPEMPETPESPANLLAERVSGISGISAEDDDARERAAIMEHDGGIPRTTAEALARLEACPPGIEASLWQHAIDELARLFNGD